MSEIETPNGRSEPQRRRQHRRSRLWAAAFRHLWRGWRVELLVASLILLAVFLLVERMEIRKSLFAWLISLLQALERLDLVVLRWIENMVRRTTLSDLLAYILLLAGLGLAVWRLRWRLGHTPQFVERACPRCGDGLHRVHRRAADRLVGLFVPVRRYECKNSDCGWTGLRVKESQRG